MKFFQWIKKAVVLVLLAFCTLACDRYDVDSDNPEYLEGSDEQRESYR